MTVETIYGGADPTGVASYNTTTEGSASYSVCFVPSENGTVKQIGYFSPFGILASKIAIFQLDNITPLVENDSPSWSGAAGSGWVYADVSDTAVVAGTHYYAVIADTAGGLGQGYLYDGAGGGDVWLPHTSDAGHITTPGSITGFIDGPNGPMSPYQNGSGLSYPFTSPPDPLNWLVDVGIEFTVTDAVTVAGVGAQITVAGTAGTLPNLGINFRDQVSAHQSAQVQTTNTTLTIPGTIEAGDQMIVGVDIFTWDGNTDADIGLSATAGSWTPLGSGLYNSADNQSIGLKLLSRAWSRVATGSDAGSTVTISPLGTPSTNQYWTTAGLVAYSGAIGGVDVVAVTAGSGGSGTLPSTPTGSTTADNEWEVNIGAIGIDGSGAIIGPPSGFTSRLNEFNSGVDVMIADSNGPVGLTGTGVGDRTFDIPSNNIWYGLFTITLSPKSPTTPVSIAGVSAAITVAGGVGVLEVQGSATVQGVKAQIAVTGGVGSVKNGIKIAGVGAQITVAGGLGAAFVQVFSPSTSGHVTTYSTFSELNNTGSAGDQDMRVLVPDSPSGSYPHGFLWLLPVEPGQGASFGDSIGTIQALDAQNQYNLTCIQPGFPIDPWYGNNVDDPQTQQETFMLQLVQWAKDNLATTGTEKHYLIGFSKSGFGGEVLFLRNQSVFSAVASWDTACDLRTLGEYDETPVFGEQSNLDNYSLYNPNLTTWKAEGDTATVNRIWLGAGINLITQTSDYADRLTADGILHTYSFVEADSHAWDPSPGWVAPALAAMLPASSVSVPGVGSQITFTGTPGSPAVAGAVHISGAGAQVALAGGIGAPKAKSKVVGVSSQVIFAGTAGTVKRGAKVAGATAQLTFAGGHGTFPGGPTQGASELFVFSLL